MPVTLLNIYVTVCWLWSYTW